MTPSAVSQAVKRLEEDLSCQLFTREINGVKLTPVGRSLLVRIQASFGDLRNALNDARKTTGPVVSINCPPLFANQIVIPVLQTMLRDGAEFEFNLDSQFRGASRIDHAFDISIVYGLVREMNDLTIPLGKEYFIPVCSPSYADRIDIKDAYRSTLIINDTEHVLWSHWAALNNFPVGRWSKVVRFSLGLQAISAARRGLGLLLESKAMVDDEIANGWLVQAFLGSYRPFVHNRHFLHRSPRSSHPDIVDGIVAAIKAKLSDASGEA